MPLRTRPGVKRAKLAFARAFDTNQDGSISDRESMSYLIKLRQKNSDRGLASLMQFNQNTQRINENLNNIDADHDGVVSNQEAIKTVLDQRADQIPSQDLAITNMILENNSNLAELQNLVARVDTDPDGQISKEEVLAVLTEIRDNDLEPALVESLTQVLEMNPDLESIVDEFEASIASNYDREQHLDAQVLLTRRLQEVQILGDGNSDLKPSALGLLEELAEVYGDSYLSEDENSPDFYRLNGITGKLQETLLEQGYSLDDLVTKDISMQDMDILLSKIFQYSDDHLSTVELGLGKQHQNALNYVRELRSSGAQLTMETLFDNVAEAYGDAGFFGTYSGFTGAWQAANADFGSLDADTVVSQDFLAQFGQTLATYTMELSLDDNPSFADERIEQNVNFFDYKQNFYLSQINGLNEIRAEWQNHDGDNVREELAKIDHQLEITQGLSEFAAARSSFWIKEDQLVYPAGADVEEARALHYQSLEDFERRYEAAAFGESAEDTQAIQVELFKLELHLDNLSKGLPPLNLNTDQEIADIYGEEITTQARAIENFAFSKFKVNFFNKNISGLDNVLEQWQNSGREEAANHINNILDQTAKTNDAIKFWDTRDEFWKAEAMKIYDPSQTEAVKLYYESIAHLERSAESSLLGESDQSIDAINTELVQLGGVLDAMHGFNVQPSGNAQKDEAINIVQNRILEAILGGADLGNVYSGGSLSGTDAGNVFPTDSLSGTDVGNVFPGGTLSGTDVTNIYQDQDFDTLLREIAQIYGDDPIIDSRFDYLRDEQGEILSDANGHAQVYQQDANGNQELINNDTNLAGDYSLFNENGDIDQTEYNRYASDFVANYGSEAFATNAAELTNTFTGVTGDIY
ncbi:MAG: hypothetical protein OXU45_07575, partial [Candidatus Melainabacteria bacterium]|nr:hypothetical protein [Candidatus Melainabacteria bacterium]